MSDYCAPEPKTWKRWLSTDECFAVPSSECLTADLLRVHLGSHGSVTFPPPPHALAHEAEKTTMSLGKQINASKPQQVCLPSAANRATQLESCRQGHAGGCGSITVRPWAIALAHSSRKTPRFGYSLITLLVITVAHFFHLAFHLSGQFRNT